MNITFILDSEKWASHIKVKKKNKPLKYLTVYESRHIELKQIVMQAEHKTLKLILSVER